MQRFKKIFVLFGSLLLTPVILFIYTTNSLYINNQMDFGYSYQVLYPFLWLFVIAVAVGFILHRFSEFRIARYILLLYYGIGPFFILYTGLRNLSVPLVESAIGFIIFIILFLGLFIFISEKFKDSSFVAFFAFLGFFFLFIEAYSFYAGFQSAPSSRIDADYTQIQIDTKTKRLPNIYLLLLDGFQTEMFDATITPKVRESLGNFVYFHENTALFGRTGMSIPSIFGGKSYEFKGPQLDYKENSFTSGSSMLAWLKKAGYAEYAFVRDEIRGYNDLSLFDFVIEHENKQGGYTPHSAFFGAWVYRNLPLFASTSILGAERLERIKGKDSLSRNASVSSYDGFLRYLENEKDLPASNRFTFLYMLLPHTPFIFNDDCSYSSDFSETGPLSQSRCATSLIVKFLKTLKELDRLNDSMIIITADHGLSFRTEGGKLKNIGNGKMEPHWARSRALLLLKPAGTTGINELVTSEFQSSLLDIAPTVAASLANAPPVDFEGVSLLNPALPLRARKKYYYFFEKKGVIGWTDEMNRYIIEDNRIREDGVVKIENNGPPPIRFQRMTKDQKAAGAGGAGAAGGPKRSSEAELRAASEKRPDLVVPYLNLSEFYIKEQRYNKAKAAIEKAIALEPGDLRMRLRLAFINAQLGLLDEAEEDFKHILKTFPGWSEALSGLGNVYFLQRRFGDALKYFLLTIDARPGESEAVYNAAMSLERLGRDQEAIEYYERFVSRAPKGYEGALRTAKERIQILKTSR